MLVGNKVDLVKKNPQARVVKEEEVHRLCKDNQLLYQETSAIEGTNVPASFEQLIRSKGFGGI